MGQPYLKYHSDDKLSTQYSCKTKNSAAVVILTSNQKTLTWDENRWDTSNMHDTTTDTHLIKAPVKGRYIVTLNVRFCSNSTGYRYTGIQSPTYTEYHLIPAVSSSDIVQSTILELDVGEAISAVAWQNSGGNCAMQVLGSHLSLTLLHRM